MNKIKETKSILKYEYNTNSKVSFDKKELGIILKLYGQMVAIGEWRDYGISMMRDCSIFSIYRHTSENPLYKVKKIGQNSKHHKQYSVIAMDGKILGFGHNLSKVIKPLEKKMISNEEIRAEIDRLERIKAHWESMLLPNHREMDSMEEQYATTFIGEIERQINWLQQHL